MPKISALPVGAATSSTPFPAIVGGVTDQVTLAPIYTDLAGKAATSHTHAESDITNLITDLANRVVGLVAFASLPGAGTAGAVYFFTDSPLVVRDNGVSYDYFLSGYKVTPLNTSAWSWENQDTASVTTVAGQVIFKSGTTPGTHMFLHTAPATSVTTRILPNMAGGSGLAGICFRESGTGKIIAFFINVAKTLQINKYSATDTFSSSPITSGAFAFFPMPITLRLLNGATLSFQYSVDGAEYTTLFSEAKATFFTVGPNQVGFFSDSGASNANLTVESWIEI